MIATILMVPLASGKPAIPEVANTHADLNAHAATFNHESGEAATFRYLGDRNGKAIYCGMASKGHGTWLIGTGITLQPLETYSKNPPNDEWLAQFGVVWPATGIHHFYGGPQGDEVEIP